MFTQRRHRSHDRLHAGNVGGRGRADGAAGNRDSAPAVSLGQHRMRQKVCDVVDAGGSDPRPVEQFYCRLRGQPGQLGGDQSVKCVAMLDARRVGSKTPFGGDRFVAQDDSAERPPLIPGRFAPQAKARRRLCRRGRRGRSLHARHRLVAAACRCSAGSRRALPSTPRAPQIAKPPLCRDLTSGRASQ